MGLDGVGLLPEYRPDLGRSVAGARLLGPTTAPAVGHWVRLEFYRPIHFTLVGLFTGTVNIRVTAQDDPPDQDPSHYPILGDPIIGNGAVGATSFVFDFPIGWMMLEVAALSGGQIDRADVRVG